MKKKPVSYTHLDVYKRQVKYLGITLLPQAGVALGMCVSAQALGAADGLLVRNIVLFLSLIHI